MSPQINRRVADTNSQVSGLVYLQCVFKKTRQIVLVSKAFSKLKNNETNRITYTNINKYFFKAPDFLLGRN